MWATSAPDQHRCGIQSFDRSTVSSPIYALVARSGYHSLAGGLLPSFHTAVQVSRFRAGVPDSSNSLCDRFNPLDAEVPIERHLIGTQASGFDCREDRFDGFRRFRSDDLNIERDVLL